MLDRIGSRFDSVSGVSLVEDVGHVVGYSVGADEKLFGNIDTSGSNAIRAFLSEDISAWHHNFENLFIYLDAQKFS